MCLHMVDLFVVPPVNLVNAHVDEAVILKALDVFGWSKSRSGDVVSC